MSGRSSPAGQPKTGYGTAILINGKIKNFDGIANSSETVLFGDSAIYDSSLSTGYAFKRSRYLASPSAGASYISGDNFHGRHVNGAGVLSFYDGHAEAVASRVKETNLYPGGTPATVPPLVKTLHLGAAMPFPIDYSLATNNASYLALCKNTYDQYF